MAELDVGVRVNAEARDFTEAFERMLDVTKRLTDRMKAFNKQLREVSNTINKVTSGTKAYSNAVDSVSSHQGKATRATDKIERATDKLGKTTRKTARNTRSFSGGILRLSFVFSAVDRAMGSAINSVQRFGAAIIQTAVSGVELNLQFQAMEVRLEGIFQGAGQSAALLERFRKVAESTAFTITDVTNAGVTLAAFLGNMKHQTKSLIKPLSDLAAFMNVDMVSAANALGRAFAGGAGAADILRDRGVLNLVRDRSGVDDLKKMSKTDFREHLIATITDPLGGIAGATDRLSKTTKGALSNLQDAWEVFSRALTGPIMHQITRGAKSLTKILGEAAKRMVGANSLEDAFKTLADGIKNNGEQILHFLGKMSSLLSNIAKFSANIDLGKLQGIGKGIGTGLVALGGARIGAGAVRGGKAVLGAVAKKGLVGAAGGFLGGGGIGALIGAIVGVTASLVALKIAADAAAESVKSPELKALERAFSKMISANRAERIGKARSVSGIKLGPQANELQAQVIANAQIARAEFKALNDAFLGIKPKGDELTAAQRLAISNSVAHEGQRRRLKNVSDRELAETEKRLKEDAKTFSERTGDMMGFHIKRMFDSIEKQMELKLAKRALQQSEPGSDARVDAREEMRSLVAARAMAEFGKRGITITKVAVEDVTAGGLEAFQDARDALTNTQRRNMAIAETTIRVREGDALRTRITSLSNQFGGTRDLGRRSVPEVALDATNEELKRIVRAMEKALEQSRFSSSERSAARFLEIASGPKEPRSLESFEQEAASNLELITRDMVRHAERRPDSLEPDSTAFRKEQTRLFLKDKGKDSVLERQRDMDSLFLESHTQALSLATESVRAFADSMVMVDRIISDISNLARRAGGRGIGNIIGTGGAIAGHFGAFGEGGELSKVDLAGNIGGLMEAIGAQRVDQDDPSPFAATGGVLGATGRIGQAVAIGSSKGAVSAVIAGGAQLGVEIVNAFRSPQVDNAIHNFGINIGSAIVQGISEGLDSRDIAERLVGDIVAAHLAAKVTKDTDELDIDDFIIAAQLEVGQKRDLGRKEVVEKDLGGGAFGGLDDIEDLEEGGFGIRGGDAEFQEFDVGTVPDADDPEVMALARKNFEDVIANVVKANFPVAGGAGIGPDLRISHDDINEFREDNPDKRGLTGVQIEPLIRAQRRKKFEEEQGRGDRPAGLNVTTISGAFKNALDTGFNKTVSVLEDIRNILGESVENRMGGGGKRITIQGDFIIQAGDIANEEDILDAVDKGIQDMVDGAEEGEGV